MGIASKFLDMLKLEENDGKKVDGTEKVKAKKVKLSRSEKLLKKVEELAEKVENETNPAKLFKIKIQLKMLESAIDREIAVIDLKKEYQEKKEKLDEDYRTYESDASRNLARIKREIGKKSNILRIYDDYDYEESDFIYPKNYVEKKGGIKSFAESLKESDDLSEQYTGQKILEMARLRKEINELESQAKEYKQILADGDKELNKEKKQLSFEEKRLITQKDNWRIRFSSLFNAIKDTIKEFKTEREEKKKSNSIIKSKNEEIDAEYKEQKEELDRQYKEYLKEIEEKREADKKQAKENEITAQKEKQKEERNTRLGNLVLKGEALKEARKSGRPVEEDELEVKVGHEEGQGQQGEDGGSRDD